MCKVGVYLAGLTLGDSDQDKQGNSVTRDLPPTDSEAKFRENTAMHFRVTVRKLNVTDRRTDRQRTDGWGGGGGSISPVPGLQRSGRQLGFSLQIKLKSICLVVWLFSWMERSVYQSDCWSENGRLRISGKPLQFIERAESELTLSYYKLWQEFWHSTRRVNWQSSIRRDGQDRSDSSHGS